MNNSWPCYKVEELQHAGFLLVEDGNHGEYRPRRNEFGSGETVFIRAADMKNGRIEFETADRINSSAVERIRKGIGKGGDIIFSHKGTVGKLALALLDSPPFVCSPQTTFWRTLNEQQIDRRFLYYYMSSREFSTQWSARKGETDMADYVSLTAQRELFLRLPPIEEQRAIARSLGPLDDKIELNRQMSQTLEKMAQAIFKSWFVDFDPVVAKADGRKPYGMSPEIAAHFPSRFQNSELGPIPERWRVGTLGNLVEIQNGYAFKSKDWQNSGVPVVKIGSVKPGVVDLSKVSYVSEGIARQQEHYRVSVGDILIGMTGYPGEVGLVPPTDNLPLLNQRVGKFVFSEQGEGKKGFVFCFTRRPDFKLEVECRSHGTAQLNVSASQILSISLVIPSQTILSHFSKFCKSILERLLLNYEEIECLDAIKNSLLPKLLSGEIRVKQAEKLVEEAV